jgi:hypothetical protein
LEQALSNGLENCVRITRITDVQPVVCWSLHGKRLDVEHAQTWWYGLLNGGKNRSHGLGISYFVG